MSTTTSQQQRSYYHEDIDFPALALKDEDFAALLRSNDGRIDWQDPSAVQYGSPMLCHTRETNTQNPDS